MPSNFYESMDFRLRRIDERWQKKHSLKNVKKKRNTKYEITIVVGIVDDLVHICAILDCVGIAFGNWLTRVKSPVFEKQAGKNIFDQDDLNGTGNRSRS